MKTTWIVIIGVGVMACGQPKHMPPMTDSSRTVTRPRLTGADTLWYSAFRDLQDAWVKGDRSRVAGYFDFPIVSDENYIWALSGADYKLDTDPKTGDTKLIPFTAKDFDRYYPSLFPPEFSSGVGKVVIHSLQPGDEQVFHINGNDSMQYVFSVALDSASTYLRMQMESRYKNVHDGTGDEDFIRSIVAYSFRIAQRKTLRFEEVGLGD
jgi:hypothetical protein